MIARLSKIVGGLDDTCLNFVNLDALKNQSVKTIIKVGSSIVRWPSLDVIKRVGLFNVNVIHRSK